MAEIRLSGVDKVYPGGTHAVHGVDLHIADGEFMIMVGPSGCAKSTILRMIAGLEVPTGGTIEIGGRVVNDVAPKDRDIAMVFQSYALYPHMTVRENMAFGLRLRRMPQNEIDQRVGEAARILGLEHLLDRLPKAMSGGQRQRVAMGRAIVREPQAFLMDEPLSNLDAKLRVQMRTEIAKLHQRLRTTTVYVTHDQVEALTLGQRICILRKGVVQQVDTPFQVYQNPANVFVGGFIGSPGMNFMSGTLVLHDGTLFLQLGDRHLPLPTSVTTRLLASDVHGRSVIVGIRPENLAVSDANDDAALRVDVELVEAMGAEQYAYFTAQVATPDLSELSDTQSMSSTFTARLDAGAPARGGEPLHLRPDLHELHLFDPASMLTMLAPAEEADVRARQSGSSTAGGRITLTSAPRVVAPPAPARIHVPGFDVDEFAPAVAHAQIGMLPDGDPARVASVFDQPMVVPIATTPIEPALAVGSDLDMSAVGAASTTASTTTHQPSAPMDTTFPAPTARPSGSFAARPLRPNLSAQAAPPPPPPAVAAPGASTPSIVAAPRDLDAAIGATEADGTEVLGIGSGMPGTATESTAVSPVPAPAPAPAADFTAFRSALARMKTPAPISGVTLRSQPTLIVPPSISLDTRGDADTTSN